MLIDDTIPGHKNVIKKAAEKMLKYKDLTTEIQHMWNVKARVIPVIIGVTGTTSKSLKQYLSNIPGKNKIKNWKKRERERETGGGDHIGHSTLTAESANVKYKTYFPGKITLHVAEMVNTE